MTRSTEDQQSLHHGRHMVFTLAICKNYLRMFVSRNRDRGGASEHSPCPVIDVRTRSDTLVRIWHAAFQCRI